MTQFRKKPAVVDAWQWNQNSDHPAWLTDAFTYGQAWYQGGVQPCVIFKTSDGYAGSANVGDWIIRNTKGELSALTPPMFEATYEPAA